MVMEGVTYISCDLIDAGSVQGWIRPFRRFFPRCLVREDTACDVGEVLWPDPARHLEIMFMYFYILLRICSDFQCKMQPLEMHGCID